MPVIIRAAISLAVAAILGFGITTGAAWAQTYGFATLPPGTLNHTTATAVSKVLKEKGGMNVSPAASSASTSGPQGLSATRSRRCPPPCAPF